MKALPRQYLLNGAAVLVALIIVGFAALNPLEARAVGSAADLMCIGCQMDPTKPLYCPTVTCTDITSLFSTTGHCAAPGVCLGTGSSGGFGLDKVAQILGPLMQALMKGSQNGSASPSDTSLTTPCQSTAPTGVAAQLTSSPTTASSPCDVAGASTVPSSLLTSSLTPTYSTNALTNALTGSNCTDAATCGISNLAGQLASATSSTAGPSVSLVPNNAIVPQATVVASSTATSSTNLYGQGVLLATGSSIAPQGLNVMRNGSDLVFNYAPLGQNSQIAGFISCSVSAANAVPYVPLSAIQNACQ